MNAISLLGLSREQLLAVWPDLIVHDNPADIQEQDTRAYTTPASGEFEAILHANNTVGTVFVYRESILLQGIIAFSSQRGDVRKRFGHPDAHCEEQDYPYIGRKGAWDRFDFPRYSLHFEYVLGGTQLGMLTVMSSEVVRRVDSGIPSSA